MNSLFNRCACLLLLLTCLCAAASQISSGHARSLAAPLLPAQTTSALAYLVLANAGQSIAVDAQGNAFVGGTLLGNGNRNLAVTKFNAAGTQRIYDTILPGSDDDLLKEIALDGAGNVYITGSTYSPDLAGAARQGGVFFKSTDGGLSWERSGAELRRRYRQFETLLVDPNNPLVVYAGSSTTGLGETIFKSADGGRTWSALDQNLGAVLAARLLAVQGGTATTVYVGTSGGLLKSIDGGATWSEAGLKDAGGVNLLVVDPSNPAQLYAVAGNNRNGGQVYRSTDGAANWQAASQGLPLGLFILHLAIDHKTPTTLYAVARASNGAHTIYRSIDGARNWHPLPSDFTRASIQRLTVDPFNATTLYASTGEGLFKSTDAGEHWQAAGLANLFVSMVLSDPNQPGTFYAAAPRKSSSAAGGVAGIYKSTDGGLTWQQFEHGLRGMPVTTLAFDPLHSGTLYALTESYPEAFALKLNATGTEVSYIKYLGPGEGTALVVDGSGQVYVAGALLASSANAQIGSGEATSFITRLNANGENSNYHFTWAGQVADLALDQAGKLYVAGTVSSGNTIPIKDGWRAEFTGSAAGFLAKLDPQKTGADALLYATYLEFGSQDAVQRVAVDARGRAIVLGSWGNALQTPFTNKLFDGVGTNTFLVQLDTNKSGAASLGWSTQLAGATYTGLAVDAGGSIYLTGTAGAGYPTTPGALQEAFAGACSDTGCSCELVMGFCPARCSLNPLPRCIDTILAQINAEGTSLIYSSYLSGGQLELARDIAVDQAGHVYLTGQFNTPDGSAARGFIAKLALAARSTAVASVSAASFAGPQLARESLAVGFLDAFGAGANNLRVQIRDSAGTEANAPVLYAGPRQINFQLPPRLATGSATVRVLRNSGVIANGAVEIVVVAPGVFTANANGRGVAAAVAQRVSADNTQTYEPVARFDPAQHRFVAVPIDLGAATEQVFLVLFGTGWRYRSAETAVKVTVGGVEVPVTYAGLQPTLAGVDQINARLPRSLQGRGEVDVVVTVDAQTANTVRISIK